MAVIRCDFHHHCSTDPVDVIFYTARDLVDRAVDRGLHAIAITPHGRVFEDPDAVEYARGRGLLLIPGIEKKVEGKEVLILNLAPGEVPGRCSFDDLRALRARRGPEILVAAPHPFYPKDSCLGPTLDRHADCFDAVEYAHLHGWGWNPNRQAVAWAEANRKPVIATSDTHHLDMVGHNYTEVEAAAADTRAIFDAIRAGRVRAVTRPFTLPRLLAFGFGVVVFQALMRPFHRRETA